MLAGARCRRMVLDAAIRRILDLGGELLHAASTMRSRTAVVEVPVTHTVRAPSVRAPSLAQVVEALLAYVENPADRRAKIAVALLQKQGALDCPACGTEFDVEGYRGTRTAFSARRAIVCLGCRTNFVVEESELS